MTSAARSRLRLAIVGAGPVGLTLALLAAQLLPHARVTLFDARPIDADPAADARTLALALGSVQLLQRLGAWRADSAEPITAVHVSQLGAGWPPDGTVTLRAAEAGVPMLGAVLGYGDVVAPLQAAWVAQADGDRLAARFGTPVAALVSVSGGVEVDAGIVETHDLVVVAEGGVFADQARRAVVRDYGQTAWVGTATLEGATPGMAVERFTRHGPLALLPRGSGKAALVWCVPRDDDPVAALDDRQRMLVLGTMLPPEAGRIVALSPLKDFALGLNAERSLVQGRIVRIGNAAQTLHPVAGQGLNLGLRDAFQLADTLRRGDPIDEALRRVAWSRAPDRWSTIAATDFLARSFTWRWPGLGALRGAALAALDRAPPLKAALARHMMFGLR